MKFNFKQLFLIDGAGALISAFFLGIILVKFEHLFGMPVKVLYLLSVIACMLAIYSLSCFIFVKKNRKPYLQIIAVANLIYCCFTMCLVFYYSGVLTTMGLLYFFAEVVLITTLVFIELKTASEQV